MGPKVNQLGLSRAHILHEVDESLKRLQMDYIDLYQIHGRDPLTPLEETLDALNDCVRAGKVRYIGFSNLAAWQITKSLWISDKKNLARFESVQAYYSIAGRDLEREIVPLCNDQNLAILPWSPLAGGLLSGKFTRNTKDPEGARRTTFDFPPVDREKAYDIIDAIKPIADAHDSSVARVALAWLLHQPHVTSVIIGAKTRAQLDDNLAAADLKLTAEDLATLDKVSALNRSTRAGCSNDSVATDSTPSGKRRFSALMPERLGAVPAARPRSRRRTTAFTSTNPHTRAANEKAAALTERSGFFFDVESRN